MPLTRYFIFVGGVLLALLYVADWFWQNQSLMPSYGPPIDETIVRIRSEHKWPQKVELDTTMPTIVPPPAAAETVETTTSPAPKPALNALAQANRPQKQAEKRKPTAHARFRNSNSAREYRFVVNPMPLAWPVGW